MLHPALSLSNSPLSPSEELAKQYPGIFQGCLLFAAAIAPFGFSHLFFVLRSCLCLFLVFVCFISRSFVFVSQTYLRTINLTSPSAEVVSSSSHHILTLSLPILASRMSFTQTHRSSRTGDADSRLAICIAI
jgi:hypothetical protein